MAFDDDAVDWYFLAGSHADGFIEADIGNGYVRLLAVPDHARGFGLKTDKALDGLRRLAAGAHLERLTEIDQRNNDSCRFEVGMARETRHDTGKDRHEHGVHPCRAGAERDQRVHVGVMGAEGLPGPTKEMPAGVDQHPQRHRADPKPEDPAGRRIEHGHEAQRLGQHERETDDASNDEFAQQRAVMSKFRGLLFALILETAQFRRAITGRRDRRNECLGIDITLHRRGVLGKIHRGLDHARHIFQRVLDRGHATGAAHARDGKTVCARRSRYCRCHGRI